MPLYKFLAYVYSELSISFGSDFTEDEELLSKSMDLWKEMSSDGICDMSPEEIADEVATW